MSRPKAVTPLDTEIGQRIKALRTLRGISLTSIGRHLGVSFQQVQKYESGANRLSAARLTQLATLLEASVYDILGTDASTSESDANHELMGFLFNKEILALAQAFAAIENPELRRTVLAMVETAARTSGPHPRSDRLRSVDPDTHAPSPTE